MQKVRFRIIKIYWDISEDNVFKKLKEEFVEESDDKKILLDKVLELNDFQRNELVSYHVESYKL